VPIKERGPGICAVVSFLVKCPQDDAQIKLWVDNLRSSVEKLCSETGKKVRVFPLILRQLGLPEYSSLRSRLRH